MLVKDDTYKLLVTVECHGKEVKEENKDGVWNYKVPVFGNINIFIMNKGNNSIVLTNDSENMSWEFPVDERRKITCQNTDEDEEIKDITQTFRKGTHFPLRLRFYH